MQYKINIKSFFLFIFLIGVAVPVFSQQTAVYTDPDWNYKSSVELFNKEKYSAAAQEFEKYIAESDIHSLNHINAEYFLSICAVELFHPDAEKKLASFIENHPENMYAKYSYFQMGRIYYKQKKYKGAIEWFEKTDISTLNNEEIAEYYFKLGYSYYIKGDMQKANSSFHSILNTESKYKTAALYYYAHTAYANNNYATALENFQKLKDSETFGVLVPYYIVQIYYEQGKYDELVSYAVPLLENPKLQNATDIKRLVAESYYRKNQFKDALKYFDDYRKNFPQPSREDYYQIAFCRYKMAEYDLAIQDFERVVNVKDITAQNAYYHLGDCFIQKKNKESARNAFQFASKMDFDKSIKEDALFNYAKLSYELNYQPVAVNAFRDFIKNFPQSKNIDRANEFLGQVYLTTKNYKDALAVLETVTNKSATARAAYQKVAYYRGIEFYNDGDKEKAIGLFNKAIVTNSDPDIQALAMYWKAEALYEQQKFDEAIKEYRIFIFNPKSINLSNYNTANYGIGYCYFKQENYSDAQTWFRKYIKNKIATDAGRYNDALIRIGDAFFMQKDYANAQSFYSDAITNNAKASDYCLFQKGMIQGIEGNIKTKESTMTQLATKYPKSSYVDDAVYERGSALLALNENSEAEYQFRKIINSYPQSNYVKKAKLNVALIYYNDKKDEQALNVFKQVIKDYPSTPEATEALTQVKNIYVSSGNPNGYFEYVKTVPFASISSGAQDSITYEAAEQRYLKGETDFATKDFENYLARFPEGVFVLNATFYKSECDYKAKDFESAINGYETILEKPKNVFTEKSLLKAATINYKNKNYEKALSQFHELEETADFKDNIIAAQTGQMRCNFFLKKYDAAIMYAHKVLAQDKAVAEQLHEAHLIYGKSALETSDLSNAINEFKAISKITNSAMGAEAKYSLALIAHLQNNFKDSQKKCFEVINQVPAYDYWVAKSFILLADNYLALKDTFQAKHTLKSIIENYEKNPDDAEDLKSTAQLNYDAIISTEKEIERKEIEEKELLIPAVNDTLDEN
ncbi:MAG: tetratricopeptide repeat protein [Bacteroidia bacterium]